MLAVRRAGRRKGFAWAFGCALLFKGLSAWLCLAAANETALAEPLETVLRSLVARATALENTETESAVDLDDLVFVLDSTSRDADFSLQFEARGASLSDDARTSTCRRVYECTRHELQELVFTDSGLPGRLAIGGDVYCFENQLPWKHFRNSLWAFSVSVRPLRTWCDIPAGCERPGGLIQVDLGDFLKRIVPARNAGVTLRWNRITSSLHIEGEAMNGVVYVLRFRTPNDTERFGTCLSQVRNSCDSRGSSLAWSHFIVGKPSALRFRIPDRDEVTSALGACDSRQFDFNDAMQISAQSPDALLPLWSTLTSVPEHNEGASDVKDFMGWHCGHHKIGVLSKCLAILRLSKYSGDHKRTEEECTAVALTVLEELRLAQRCIRRGLGIDDDAAGIDDPLLQWRAFEMYSDSREAFLIFERVLAFVKGAPVSSEIRYALCDAIADMGLPPLDSYHFDDAGGTDEQTQVCSAILNSHWQRECLPAETEACFKALSKAAECSVGERVLVETLVRLGEWERIPTVRLSAWLKSDAIGVKDFDRAEVLRVASLTSIGCVWLVGMAKEESLDEALRKRVVAALLRRAEATVRTKRFDFISEAECQSILAMKQLSAEAP